MLDFTLEEIRVAIYAADKASIVKSNFKLLDYYIMDYLSAYNDQFPEDALEFIIEILSTEVLFTKKGVPSFFSAFFYDSDFSEIQKNRLFEVICNNYFRYSNMDFCRYLCYIITNICRDADELISIFDTLAKSATYEGKEAIEIARDFI